MTLINSSILFSMGSVINKTCIWTTFIFQTSLVEVVVLQLKGNATITTKKLITKIMNYKQMGYLLNGSLKIGFQTTLNKCDISE